MSVREWSFGGRRVTRLCCDSAAPVLYVHGDAKGLESLGWTVVSIEGIDWNRDLTPWPAKSVFRGQSDFTGGAGDYLRELTEEIIPAVEADLKPRARCIMGYSLSGLFAVYAALETELFDAVASVSGSMWYPGFARFVEEKQPVVRLAYFSVGDREKLGRNAAFHSIEECTGRVRDSLAQRGVETLFELNSGGHFHDPEGRMLRALCWLKESLKGKEAG